jgi:outer membrane receptor protein involved in Fe transport
MSAINNLLTEIAKNSSKVAYGAKETKARIPEKSVFGANITYSWQKERYSVSLDCQNLFNQTVYDNYKLQKPGRTLFAKFRVFFY